MTRITSTSIKYSCTFFGLLMTLVLYSKNGFCKPMSKTIVPPTKKKIKKKNKKAIGIAAWSIP